MKTIKVKAKAYWCCASRPNKKSKKYQVDLANLDAATVKELTSAGLTVKNGKDLKNPKPEMGAFITPKSKFAITVLDRSGKKLDCPVGNGSDVIAFVKAIPYNFEGEKGVTAGIDHLLVTNLVAAPQSTVDMLLEAAQDELGF